MIIIFYLDFFLSLLGSSNIINAIYYRHHHHCFKWVSEWVRVFVYYRICINFTAVYCRSEFACFDHHRNTKSIYIEKHGKCGGKTVVVFFLFHLVYTRNVQSRLYIKISLIFFSCLFFFVCSYVAVATSEQWKFRRKPRKKKEKEKNGHVIIFHATHLGFSLNSDMFIVWLFLKLSQLKTLGMVQSC